MSVMRFILIFFIATVTSGCVTQLKPPTAADTREADYIFVEKQGEKTCYSRFHRGLPADRVCTDGDRLRYIRNFADREIPEVPPQVLALFRAIPAQAALLRKASVPAPIIQ